MWSNFIRDRKSQEILLFALIIGLASYLRFFSLPDHMPLIGDQAKDYFVARDMVETGQVPILGIESSQPQFRQGPLYIWLLALHFALFGYAPEFTGYLASALGVAAVGLLYIFGRRYFGRRTAFYASALLAVSPLAVAHSQLAFIINPIPLLSVGYLLSLLDYTKRRSQTLFWPALWFGLLFQCELAGAPLILLLPVAYFLKQAAPSTFKTSSSLIQNLKSLIQGLVLGLLPQIIYDLTHSFKQLGLFSAWVGYRLAAFAGYRADLAFSPGRFAQSAAAIKLYVHRFLTANETLYLILGLIILVGLLLWFRLKTKASSPVTLVWSWILILLLSYVVHGSPSEAYFPALFVPLTLAIGWTFSQVTAPNAKLLAPLLLSIIMAANSYTILTVPSTAWLPRLGTQQAIVALIKQEVGSPVRLRSIGPGSQFPAFLDNFRYLLWYQGVELAEDGQPVWLTFGPEKSSPPFVNMKSYFFDELTVSLPL